MACSSYFGGGPGGPAVFRYGYYNDLVMRVSMPTLFVLSVLVLRAIFDSKTRWLYRLAFLVVLAIGSITPIIEAARHVASFSEALRLAQQGDLWSLHEDFPGTRDDYPFILQYIGGRETWFFRYMSRKSR